MRSSEEFSVCSRKGRTLVFVICILVFMYMIFYQQLSTLGQTVKLSEIESHAVMEMSERQGHTVKMHEREGRAVVEMTESEGQTVEMSESEGLAVEMPESEGHAVKMPETEGHAMEMSESKGLAMEMPESEGHVVKMPGSEGHAMEMPESKGHAVEMPDSEGHTMEMFDTKGKADKVMHYDVLLNSYMRSGSTLSGIVLGSRDDSFYLYEPLWKCARRVKWRGNSTLCRTDRYECRDVKPGDLLEDEFYDNIDKKPGCSLDMARNILQDFYDCRINALGSQALDERIQIRLGGPSWRSIRDCITNGSTSETCVHKYAPKLCRTATHRVSKILRLSTDIYDPIMEERKNLKVFHLFRDPRAIINSRMHRTHVLKTDIGFVGMTKALCDQMIYDFHKGKKLMEKYPGRFKFLFYEDLNENPLEKVQAMYRFVGMNHEETSYSLIKNISVFIPEKQQTLREKNTAFWWRETMDWKRVTKIDDICADVYKALGYISIKNLDDFRDLSIPSVNFNRQYLL